MVTIRYKSLKSGKFSVYFDIYTKTVEGKGKRNYEFLGIYVLKDYSNNRTRILEKDSETMKLVQVLRNNKETELNFSKYGYTQTSRISYELLDYLADCLKKKHNHKLDCLIIHLNKYLKNKSFLFSEVTIEFLDKFQDYLLLYVSRNTTNAYMSVFRQNFNKLLTRGLVEESPFHVWKPVKEEYLERDRLTIEEVRILANKIPKRGNSQIRHAFLFSCFCGGLRVSDIKNITYDNIIDGKLVFRPVKTPNKVVTVPIVEDVYAILDGMVKHPINKKIFWDLPTSQTINLYLKFWAYEAGIIKNLHFHVARHTFATIGLTFGIDLFTMKELLGHSKIEMTQIYAKIVDKKKEEELMKFPTL